MKKIIMLLFLIFSTLITAFAQVTVTGSSGADGTYVNLRMAFVAINSHGTQSGNNIIITISASITDNNTAVLNQPTTSSWNTLTVYPTVSGLVLSGSVAGPLIDLNGADNVTIDGRVNASGSVIDLALSNSDISTNSSTVRFINSAENNTVKYCTIKGSEQSNYKGIVFFSTASSGNGNDGNLIDNNNITSDAAGRSVNTVYSQGSPGFGNSGITVSNNNIYDFMDPGPISNGVFFDLNTTDCTVSGNSFYETNPAFTPTSSGSYKIININNTGTGFTVSGNYIGGSASLCGGTAWTKINSFNNTFSAIYLNVGIGTPSSVQSNIIRNINWSNSGTAEWAGIEIAAGDINIGTITGNTIGETTGTGSIKVTDGVTGAFVYGINIAGAGTINCLNNIIGSVTTSNLDANSTHFYGINNSTTGTITISNNTIGSTSTAASIYTGSPATGNAQRIYGIYNSGTGTVTMNNNTTANLTNATVRSATTTTGCTTGIKSISGTNIITNNTVHDLTIANANEDLWSNASVCGISLYGVGLSTVSGNTIYNLSNTFATLATGGAVGIFFSGNTSSNTISGNFIHDLSLNPSSTAAVLIGINIIAGSSTYSNNIISLGGNTATDIYGIFESGNAGNDNNLYFNTVYIGGNLASGITNTSYCLYSSLNTNIRNFRNNILHNARSTVGASHSHYAVRIAGTSGLTIDYNDYYTSGTGGMLGYISSDLATLSAWKTATTQDANSLNVNPTFINAGSPFTMDYYATSALNGTLGTGILTDYSGVTRSTVSPKQGALETNNFTWKGSTDNDFAKSSNWTESVVPLPGSNIVFDVSPSNDCYLDQNRIVLDITNTQSTYKPVVNGKQLTVNRNLNFSGGAQIDASATNSSIVFGGTAIQSIPAGAFVNNQVYNLTVNNAFNVTLDGTLNLLNTLTVASGRLDAVSNSSSVIYGGSTAQTITSGQYLNDRFYDFTSDNTAGVTLNSNFTVNHNLNINSAKIFTIAAGINLTVSGAITNSGGSSGFILKSDAGGTASLINSTSGVTATTERYVIGNQWHFMFPTLSSIPTSTYTVEGASTNKNLYSYNESTPDYWNATTSYGISGWNPEYASTNLRTDKGYIFNRYNLPSKTFSQTGGTLSVGQKDFTITNTVHSSAHPEVPQDWDYFDGWNLIGNPYASAIDWNHVTISNIESAVYYNDGTKYQCYIPPAGGGTYPWDASGGINVNGGSRYIPSGQGVMVKAAGSVGSGGATFSFFDSDRIHNSQTFWKKQSNVVKNLLRLQIEQNDYTDETVYRTLPSESQVTNGHDAQFDAYKMFAWDKTKPQIFTTDPVNSDYYAINSQIEFSENNIVPVGLYIVSAGQYKIRLTENDFADTHIWLEDKYLNADYDLLKNPLYTFDQSAQTVNDRFYLHFQTNHAPILTSSIPNQNTKKNDLYQYTIPANLFADNDFGDSLIFSATLADGNPLPQWLSFNSDTKTFSGIPDTAQTLQIKVTVADIFGLKTSADFILTVTDNTGINMEPQTHVVTIYPNPTDGKFLAITNPDLKNGKIEIRNVFGCTLRKLKIENAVQQFDIGDLSPGIYFIGFTTDNLKTQVKIIKR
jgi:hypothetical protein